MSKIPHKVNSSTSLISSNALRVEETILTESSPAETVVNGTEPRDSPVTTRFVEYTYVLCGITVLFGWNAIITAFSFFAEVFKGTSFENSFRNIFSLAFTFVGLIASVYSLSTQNKGNYEKRVIIGFSANIIIFLMFSAFPYMTFIKGPFAFYFCLILIILSSVFTGISQTSINALASMMPPSCMQGMMSGQAIAGLISSITQLVTAYLTSKKGSDTAESDTISKLSPGLKLRTMACFLITAIIVIVSTLMFMKLKGTQLYKDLINHSAEEERTAQEAILAIQGETSSDIESANVPKVASKPQEIFKTLLSVKHYAHAVLLSFIVTLSMFPSLTSQVTSVNGKLGVSYLVEWHFVLFNAGDYIGRFLAQFVQNFTDWIFYFVSSISNAVTLGFLSRRDRVISLDRDFVYVWFMVIFGYLRWLFLPVFMKSNLSCKVESADVITSTLNQSSTLLNSIQDTGVSILSRVSSLKSADLLNYSSSSDIWFLFAILLLGITGGFIASCVMIVGPRTSINPPLAGSILGFFILFGLAVGSILSFLVTYLSC
ncbi:Nucleoside transporter FUN26 [Smittium culicis]|uniref:Nucleoside transporter FUN26 n=1 Tax=Smittium culicis TaxID=133412 RepID=A0A1R1XQX9_9FUNG|nr:Nucleoside transporter FUN26 [Smittium culicis]